MDQPITTDTKIFDRANDLGLFINGSTSVLSLKLYRRAGTTTAVAGDTKTYQITNNFPLQKWVFITISVDNATIDMYLDGKLARSCVLPKMYKVDGGGYSANLLSYGGFGGQLSTTTMYDVALNPEQVYRNYMAGPEPITNIWDWLSSFFSPGVSISVNTK
jgi:hypothetical protein